MERIRHQEAETDVKHENEPSDVVGIGSLVTVQYGDNEDHHPTFLVIDGTKELSEEDSLPDGIKAIPSTAPLMKSILGEQVGYKIEPKEVSKQSPSYLRFGLEIIAVDNTLMSDLESSELQR